eukprot:gene27516-33941_t
MKSMCWVILAANQQQARAVAAIEASGLVITEQVAQGGAGSEEGVTGMSMPGSIGTAPVKPVSSLQYLRENQHLRALNMGVFSILGIPPRSAMLAPASGKEDLLPLHCYLLRDLTAKVSVLLQQRKTGFFGSVATQQPAEDLSLRGITPAWLLRRLQPLLPALRNHLDLSAILYSYMCPPLHAEELMAVLVEDGPLVYPLSDLGEHDRDEDMDRKLLLRVHNLCCLEAMLAECLEAHPQVQLPRLGRPLDSEGVKQSAKKPEKEKSKKPPRPPAGNKENVDASQASELRALMKLSVVAGTVLEREWGGE